MFFVTSTYACGLLCFLVVGIAATPICAEKDDACEAARSQSMLQKASRISTDVGPSEDKATADGGVDDCGGAGITKELTVDSKPRCFQMYTPSGPTKPMPVVVFFHGAGGRASGSCNENGDMVKQANSFGYALVCGDAYENWQFPKIGDELGVTSANPRPCTASDTPDATYVANILETLAESSDIYDANKIYFMGFSQGSMMTAWASTCFADKIRGAIQGGSGIKLHGDAVTEEFCSASAVGAKCRPGDDDGVGIPGGACKSDPCNYFPIQPTNLNNVVGEPLRTCLYMGCDDYLAHSVNHMAVYLHSIGAPYNLEKYDGTHQAPANWMTMVAKCQGIWTGTPEDDNGITCSDSSFYVTGQMSGGGGSRDGGEHGGGGSGGGGERGGGEGRGGGGGNGGDSGARACTEEMTQFCCGDGTCGGPETADNCAADCGSGGGGGSGGDGERGGGKGRGGGGGNGGNWGAPACTEDRTRFCCGDGTCGGLETADNCAADCSA